LDKKRPKLAKTPPKVGRKSPKVANDLLLNFMVNYNFDHFLNFMLHLNFQLSAIFANFFKIEDEVKGEQGLAALALGKFAKAA
jgi:hypothetical protein